MPWRLYFGTLGLAFVLLALIVQGILLIWPKDPHPMLIDAGQKVNCEVVFVDEPDAPRNNYDYRINRPFRDGRTA